jgi:DNA-binding transcriptional regulator WhiA
VLIDLEVKHLDRMLFFLSGCFLSNGSFRNPKYADYDLMVVIAFFYCINILAWSFARFLKAAELAAVVPVKAKSEDS